MNDRDRRPKAKVNLATVTQTSTITNATLKPQFYGLDRVAAGTTVPSTASRVFVGRRPPVT
jgi:hypothetical protein